MDASANTADRGDSSRHLLHGHTLKKFFKPSEFHGLKEGVIDITLVIEKDSNLAMPLETSNWIDLYFFHIAAPCNQYRHAWLKAKAEFFFSASKIIMNRPPGCSS